MGGLERSDRSVVPWGQSKAESAGRLRDCGANLQYPWVFAQSGVTELAYRTPFVPPRSGQSRDRREIPSLFPCLIYLLLIIRRLARRASHVALSG